MGPETNLPKIPFKLQHPFLHKVRLWGASIVTAVVALEATAHGFADAEVSPPQLSSVSASASVLKSSVEDLKGVDKQCFGQYAVAVTTKVPGKDTLLPDLPLASARVAERTVIFNPDGGIIAFLYTCLNGGAAKMTINPNAPHFSGKDGDSNPNPILTVGLDETQIETILSPARGVNSREFDRSTDNLPGMLAGLVAIIAQRVPAEKRDQVLQELSGDTFLNILETTAREAAYAQAEGPCKDALLNNVITRTAIKKFLAQMSVDQYNQEHPENPITLNDAVVIDITNSAAASVTNNKMTALITGKGQEDLKKMQDITSGVAKPEVQNSEVQGAKCTLSQTVVDKNYADMPPQASSGSASPNATSSATPQSAVTSSAATTQGGGR